MFYGIGLSQNVISIYLTPLADALSLNRTAVSIFPSCINFACTLGLFFVGGIYNRISTRLAFAIAGIAMGLGYIIFSMNLGFMPIVWGSVIVGIGKAVGSTVPVSILVTEWFVKKKGTILGFCMMGSGFGSMIFSPIASLMIEKLGLWNALLIHGIVMIVLTIVAFFLVKNSPYDIGEVPYGLENENNSNKEDVLYGKKFRDIYRTKNFVGFAFVIFVIGFIINSNNIQMASFLISKGISIINAGIALSVFGAAMIIGKLVTGIICDTIGMRKTNIYMFTILILALAISFIVNSWFVFGLLFAFAFGFANPIATVPIPIWIVDLYGTLDFKQIYSNLMILFMLGSSIGTMFVGFIADVFNSYAPSFGFCILLSVVSFIIMRNIYNKSAIISSK